MTEGKKNLKSLITFHSANKIDNYSRGGGGKDKKKEKIQKNLQNKSKHKNNKCFSWVTAVRVLSLTGSHSPPHLPRMPSNTGIQISGPVVGKLRFSSGPTPLCSCLQCPQLSKLVCFVLCELSMTFYIFHRQSLPVDHVDLICCVCNCGKVLGFLP